MRRFHITADLVQRLYLRNAYSKKGGYKKDELNEKYKDKLKFIRESQVIVAKDLETALLKFEDMTIDKFGPKTEITTDSYLVGGDDSEETIQVDVDCINFFEDVDESEITSSEPTTMFLRLASPINYTFTNEETNILNDDGFCVEDNLIGVDESVRSSSPEVGFLRRMMQ